MQKKLMRNLLAWLLILAMLMSQLPTTMIVASGEDSSGTEVTRAEWLSALVEAFDMSVESGDAPDNYFSDLSSDSEYYDDILLAVEFGVVNIEAGEAIYPDEAATRDFAVTTLNFCLGFQLDEDATYSFSDSDDCSSPDDAQVAVDRGWVSLISGKFCPDEAITLDEMDAMLTDAAEILADAEMEEDHENSYTFADFVVEIDESIEVEVEEGDDNDVVTIYSTDTGLVEGDTFAIYVETGPLLYTAESITTGDSYITVTTGDADLESALLDIDVQEVVAADLSTFEAEDDVESVYLATEEEAETYSAIASAYYGKAITYSKGTLVATKEFKLGNGSKATVTFTIENLDLKYKCNGVNDFSVSVTGKVTVDSTVSIDLLTASGIDKSIKLGQVTWGGVGYVAISIELSAEAKVTASYVGNFEAGFAYYKGSFRTIKSFTKKSFSVVVEGTASVGIKASMGVNVVVAKANIYVTVGISAKFKSTTYNDGEDPENCINISAWVFTKVGYEANIKLINKKYSDSINVYDEKNSPYRISFHFEDGVQVTSCTRDSSSGTSTYVSSGTTSLGSSSYGSGSSTATGSDGETYIIYTYELDDDDNATITGYNGYASALSIPETIDGYTVVAIGDSAFSKNSTIRVVVLPDTVTTIGSYAFKKCTSLTTVKLGDGLIEIGVSAFANCESLSNISLPDTLEKIGSYAFEDCTSLMSVVLPDGVSVDMYAYSDCTSLTYVYIPINCELTKTNLIARDHGYGVFKGCSSLTNVTLEEGMETIQAGLLAGTGIQSIEIPDTVTEIEDSAFYDCENLQTVTLPDGLETIGEYAFAECSSLESVVLPSCVSVGYFAYNNCTSLTDVYIPIVLENDGRIFSGCSSLTNVTFEEGITYINEYLLAETGITAIDIPDTVVEIKEYSFQGCTQLETVNFPESVRIIDTRAFSGCTSLDNVVLPQYLNETGNFVFEDCTSLISVYIPKYMTLGEISYSTAYTTWTSTRAWGIFVGCTSLSDVTFEDGITKINAGLFAGSGLQTLEIPDTVTEIGEFAFSNCTQLTSIEIPESVTCINSYTFSYDSALTEVKFSTATESIGYGAFYECTSLAQIEIPDTVTEINGRAFYECTSLETVDIPDSVTYMGDRTFYGCTSLTSINLSSGITYIDDAMFKECSALETIEIPDSVTEIKSYVFENCTSLTSIVLPNALTTINKETFYGCISLTSIEMPNTVTSIGKSLFYGCESLTDVTLSTALTKLPESTFEECSALTSVVLPNSIANIGDSAFRKCYALTDVTFSNAVLTIEQYAFYDTNALTDVYYYGEEEDWEEISIEDDNYFLNEATVHYLGAPEDDTTGGGTTEGNYTLGDINQDGEIDYLDAMTVLRYDAEMITLDSTQLLAGDVNGDGAVDSLDAILILRYDADLIDSF